MIAKDEMENSLIFIIVMLNTHLAGAIARQYQWEAPYPFPAELGPYARALKEVL